MHKTANWRAWEKALANLGPHQVWPVGFGFGLVLGTGILVMAMVVFVDGDDVQRLPCCNAHYSYAAWHSRQRVKRLDFWRRTSVSICGSVIM